MAAHFPTSVEEHKKTPPQANNILPLAAADWRFVKVEALKPHRPMDPKNEPRSEKLEATPGQKQETRLKEQQKVLSNQMYALSSPPRPQEAKTKKGCHQFPLSQCINGARNTLHCLVSDRTCPIANPALHNTPHNQSLPSSSGTSIKEHTNLPSVTPT